MSSIVIAGDTSGTCTLSANAVAGTTVLTLPTTSGVLYSTPTAGVINVASGGTGLATLTANNVLIGNGTGNVAFVAPGTTGNVLTSNGSAWTSVAAAAFDAGTVLIFGQTSAPTGWTKDTTNYNNYALRVVTGAASTGGSVPFTTAFTSQGVSGTVGSTTLGTNEIPSHTHTYNDPNFANGNALYLTYDSQTRAGSSNTGATGGGGSHTHSFSGTAINLAVQYVDVIRATKN
jgi:hypothetical protein